MAYENVKNYTEQGGEKTVIGGTLEIKEGATVTGLAANPLTAATADTLGGIKVGAGLSIASGVLSVTNPLTEAENQAASTADDVEGLVTDFNALLSKLKAAGLMTDDD